MHSPLVTSWIRSTGEAFWSNRLKLLTDRSIFGDLVAARASIQFDRRSSPNAKRCGETLLETMAKDAVKDQNEALLEIYRRLRPGDPPTVESSRTLFNSMFFDPTRYDFSKRRAV